MPEALEAEMWRRAIAERILGRHVGHVDADERVVDPAVHRLVGERLVDVHRHGKVVIICSTGPDLVLRFGMTGRLVVDGIAPIEQLEYASGADRPEWDTLRLRTEQDVDAPALRLNDPRRLGRVEVDADLSALGPDVFDVGVDDLVAAFRRRSAPIKSVLLNQQVIAGLGNLCADEVLFHAGVSPHPSARDLVVSALVGLHAAMTERLAEMLERGGSTEGWLDPRRRRTLPACPMPGCDGRLRADRISGRTAVWCPAHQRS